MYLDDKVLMPGDLNFVQARDLDGAEFYRESEVPVAYRTRRYMCGVLLLWSRRT